MRTLAFLALGLAAACAGEDAPAIRIAAVHHMEAANALVGAELGPSAIDYLRQESDGLDLALSAGDDFELLSETRAAGLRHVKLQQRYLGVPVLHAQVMVHADDTTFLGFNGYLTANLDGFDVGPELSQSEALAIAEADRAGGASLEYAREEIRLVIRPRSSGGADLAWRIELGNDAQPGFPVGRWHYLVDARSGEVIGRFDGLESALEQASGPGGTPTRPVSWDSSLDVEPMGPEYAMYTDDLVTFDQSAEVPGMWVTGESLDDFPDPAVNDGHGYAEISLEVMRDWMGRDSIDDNGRPLLLRVHSDDVRDRIASWNDGVANFGPTEFDYESSQALDMVAHEFAHGFTEHHSGLEYTDQAGGLNESFSDVAGTVAEFFFEGDEADFHIGEDLLANGLLVVRDMSHARPWDFYAGIDPHEASAWPNRAFFLAVGRYIASTGVATTDAVRAMGHVWYTANAAYWTSGTSYEEGCRGTVDAARALGYSSEIAEGIAESWADTGIECESTLFVCDDDGSCDAGEGETCASCPEDCGSCAEDCSFWKKAKCDIGIGDCSRCDVSEPGCGDHVCDGDEDDSNCPVDCGCAALSCDQVAPFGCFCDESCHDVGDCCADRDDACG